MSHLILVGRLRSLANNMRNLGWRLPLDKKTTYCLMAVTREDVAPGTMIQMLAKLER